MLVAEGDSETAWDPLDREIIFMFGLFEGERVSGTYSTSRDEASDAVAGTCPYRHGWTLPNFSRRSWYVVMFVNSASRLQRPLGARKKSAAAIFSVVKQFLVDMGFPLAFRTDSGTEYYVRGLLQWPRNSSQVYGILYATTEWTRRERDIASF